jgi:hypothetical protein
MENKEIKVSRHCVRSYLKTGMERREICLPILALFTKTYNNEGWNSASEILSSGRIC